MKKTCLFYRMGLLMAIYFLVNATLILGSDGASQFTATGSMGTVRYGHTATLLPNGKVLIVGGSVGTNGYLASAELYNPETRTFSPTGSMGTVRCNHTMTLLPNGKVLIVGGQYTDETATFLSSAELYDPETGTFSPTGSLQMGRAHHTATLLPNGKVLIAAGGPGSYISTNTAELYDPATGTFTPTGSLVNSRDGHIAILLPNGKVLLAGGGSWTVGDILSSAELYDPATGTFTATGSMALGRRYCPATLLPNGKVLIAGGMRLAGYQTLNIAELYDPATGTFLPTGNLGTARNNHTATLLPSGKVLIAGGWNNAFLASAELYDPIAGIFTAAGNMVTACTNHTATQLDSGEVLIAGGFNDVALASAELYGNCNTPPVLYPIGDKVVNEDQLLTFTINGTDSDTGDVLTYSASNLPPGATFDAVTRTFSWTPSSDQAGQYMNIEFTVTDSGTPMELATELITITVSNVNRAPVFVPVGTMQILEGNTVQFQVSAADPDGNLISYSTGALPAGAVFDTFGWFTWTPNYEQKGNYTIVFYATDNGVPNMTSQMEVSISVGVPAPTDIVNQLISTIINLNLPKNIENSYFSNLKKVNIFISDNKFGPAINQLEAFVGKVNQDISQGKITQSIGSNLIAMANAVITQL